MLEHDLTPLRLNLDAEWFRSRALTALEAKCRRLERLEFEHGPAHRVEAMTGIKDKTCISSVRNELERTKRAIRAIEDQRTALQLEHP